MCLPQVPVCVCVCVCSVQSVLCMVGYRGCCHSAQMVGVFFIYFLGECEEMRRGGGGQRKRERRSEEEGCVSDAAMPRSHGQQ